PASGWQRARAIGLPTRFKAHPASSPLRAYRGNSHGCVTGLCRECDNRSVPEIETSRDGAVLTITLNRPDVLNAFTADMHRELEKPVLAAVTGPAAGAGVSLACACDLRIAAESATFVPAFINIGLVPDMGGTFFVRRLLGTSRAFEWMTSGRRLGAAEALDWGLVSEVVPDDRLAARAAERAAELAAMPTRGVALSKRLFDHAEHATLEEQ